MTQVAGVDGCPKGWIAIVIEDGRFARAELAATFSELLALLTDARVIAVDIPIGLPDGPEPRKADVEAKGLLGPLKASVFTTPPRAVLEATPYREANRLSKQRFDCGISAQSYALRPKIFQVDACAATDDRIYEVHPEVSFAAMNGKPLTHSKKSWHGQTARLHLLAEAGITIPSDLGPVNAIPPDDIIDAATAAWSAHRITTSKAERVGEATHDARPNRHAGFIWY
jgi:predicted RNase H-like nuclease